MRTYRHIAVIGVGNEFRRDDGVGWAVVERLRKHAEAGPPSAGAVFATCDGDPGRLIALWENAAVAVVVDAAHAHPGNPGRVHRLELDAGQIDRRGATSSHGLGLGEAVELARALELLPERLVVYAVEGADVSFGTGLSPAVAAAVDPLVSSMENELAGYQDELNRERS
ncbi:hydrogenase maturation protease [Streptomyces sp. SAS_276]|uniref:hydrogenase maturation protease n=1 Tax=Streptomyces sp. SAS_276 TaxID=3412745 RepID=UPI00403C12AD